MKNTLRSSVKRGFTLVEFMVVGVLIAIALSQILPKFLGNKDASNATADAVAINSVKANIDGQYQGQLTFDGVDEVFNDTAPEPLKKTTSGVYNIFKKKIVFKKATSGIGYTGTYPGLPKGEACVKFMEQLKTSDWNTFKVGTVTLKTTDTPNKFTTACKKDPSNPKAVVSVEMNYLI